MAKDLRISFLLDFYGDMLTETQREVVDAYYNEDLSLAEIAQDREITRQGVRDAIKRAEQQHFGDGRAFGPGPALSRYPESPDADLRLCPEHSGLEREKRQGARH